MSKKVSKNKKDQRTKKQKDIKTPPRLSKRRVIAAAKRVGLHYEELQDGTPALRIPGGRIGFSVDEHQGFLHSTGYWDKDVEFNPDAPPIELQINELNRGLVPGTVKAVPCGGSARHWHVEVAALVFPLDRATNAQLDLMIATQAKRMVEAFKRLDAELDGTPRPHAVAQPTGTGVRPVARKRTSATYDIQETDWGRFVEFFLPFVLDVEDFYADGYLPEDVDRITLQGSCYDMEIEPAYDGTEDILFTATVPAARCTCDFAQVLEWSRQTNECQDVITTCVVVDNDELFLHCSARMVTEWGHTMQQFLTAGPGLVPSLRSCATDFLEEFNPGQFESFQDVAA
ncbi:hypothetical protein [Corynebacterium sp.]|uniref:hypothetical protein n=1 Tax=Corynebacterium sp. TaxID=1720 RepID=UPI0026DB1804|nr:hypothetical protein [Corynebacterium sp.]MDO5031932.1 hypothetical protein [Corynebacterium sp.]